MQPQASSRVFAVVVAYQPDTGVLRALLDVLLAQTEGVLVVDNTPADDRRVETLCAALPHDALRLIRLGQNLGIAHALNVGIDAALAEEATHVLLSDQDSLPAPDMVAELLRAQDALMHAGRRVGVVGPTYTDRHTGITFPFQAEVPGKFFYGHRRPDATHPTIEALTLITSGTLIPASVLREVGPMREDFFIDHVDIEWSHRARAAGYALFGVGAAVMFHSMGDHMLRSWRLGWRNESAYSPVRVYYRIRNFVALCRMPGIRRRWKLRSAAYWVYFVYTQTVFGQQRLAALRMAARGLRDGLRGRMGPWQG
ncbi:glycosyltransferase family 2 protein [Metallibacterium sp.]|uniref:glycosyltransferase family 2 protein n=1 Tax=Metallibacterium sp. TaxID=2940281 RepID=UPI00262E7C8F|nr:glycosyltransferase family 2 protein [Metallibacterium sp.]